MTQKTTLLILEDESLSVLHKGILQKNPPLHNLKAQPSELVLDLEALEYSFDTLPRIAFLDRLHLRKNRFQRFSNTALLKGLIKYSTHASGMVRLQSTPALVKTLSSLDGLPIQSITLAPLKALNCIENPHQWTFLLYERSDQKCRHCLFLDKKLIFTRVVSQGSSPEQDTRSTLKYCERFGLDVNQLRIVQVGRLTSSLPEAFDTHTVETIEPDKDFFELLYQRRKTPPLLSRIFSPRMSLSPNRFYKSFLHFKAPEWVALFSKGYGGFSVILSLVFCLGGYLGGQKEGDFQRDLSTVQTQVSHFEKTHGDLLKKVDLVKVYEESTLGKEDLLRTLRVVARQKPSTLVVTRLRWHRQKEGYGHLELETENRSGALTQKEVHKSHKRFHKNLNRTFPGNVVEPAGQFNPTQEKFLIAENDLSAPLQRVYKKQYLIRGGRA